MGAPSYCSSFVHAFLCFSALQKEIRLRIGSVVCNSSEKRTSKSRSMLKCSDPVFVRKAGSLANGAIAVPSRPQPQKLSDLIRVFQYVYVFSLTAIAIRSLVMFIQSSFGNLVQHHIKSVFGFDQSSYFVSYHRLVLPRSVCVMCNERSGQNFFLLWCWR